MKRRTRKKGFTLVELLTSIFIIATLAAIMTPVLRRNMYKTHYVACKTNLRNIATALELYLNDNNGCYPTDIQNLTTEYMKTLPHCPASTSEYTYTNSTSPMTYKVTCTGNNHSTFGLNVDEPYYSSQDGLYPGK